MTDLPTAATPEPPYGSSPVATETGAAPATGRGPSKARRFGDALGNVVGEAIGFLVLFPLMIGLLCSGLVYLFSDSGNGGHSYEQVFVATAGLAFLFGLFALAVKWFWQLFLRFWPLILVIVGIVIAVKALT